MSDIKPDLSMPWLTGHFLIAMPSLLDPNFRQSVAYICEHNENGAVGLIINRPLPDMQLINVFEQMNISVTNDSVRQRPLLFGGPIQGERGFVVHRPIGNWRSSLKTSDTIAVTTSQDILEATASGSGPEELLVVLGYAGWQPKQLESEIKDNAWLTCKASPEVLFNVPFTRRWKAAGELLGIDFNTLTIEPGHG